ncbi:hypothetical protein UR09_01570 [Candidatus Nitromaritima sp. SCGC AAA799-A02]|nr:hypothetical protein UZ36_05290 [Candidatus Nitromaritima sp. SCGC AAA799-C22]KMP12211.1 hypothetical protein UR09_01570 [Candidatus Nitromaritima sp. SCGC AAA799-A02]
MRQNHQDLVIIIAEDDVDDFLFAKDALLEAGFTNELKWFQDGEVLMDYLKANENQTTENKEKIGLIFLDINMPKKNGFEVLKEMMGNKNMRIIPTIILTTSINDADIKTAYCLGANSYIKKPERFSEYVQITKTLSSYWIDTVIFP